MKLAKLIDFLVAEIHQRSTRQSQDTLRVKQVKCQNKTHKKEEVYI